MENENSSKLTQVLSDLNREYAKRVAESTELNKILIQKNNHIIELRRKKSQLTTELKNGLNDVTKQSRNSAGEMVRRVNALRAKTDKQLDDLEKHFSESEKELQLENRLLLEAVGEEEEQAFILRRKDIEQYRKYNQGILDRYDRIEKKVDALIKVCT